MLDGGLAIELSTMSHAAALGINHEALSLLTSIASFAKQIPSVATCPTEMN
jgi:hypothetical protein